MRYTTLLQLDVDQYRQYPQYPQYPRSSQNFSRMACMVSEFGDYNTQESCNSATACGWSKYKCAENSACVLSKDGTYETQEECFAQCTKWACGLPLVFKGAAGSVPFTIYATGKICANKYPCAVVKYFPMITFVAYKKTARINVPGTGRLHIKDGSGQDYTTAKYVLFKFGNQQANVPDNPKSPNTVTHWDEVINLGVDEISMGNNARSISGRGDESVDGVPNVAVSVQEGFQYQLCYRLISKSDDQTEISWPESDITLSDN